MRPLRGYVTVDSPTPWHIKELGRLLKQAYEIRKENGCGERDGIVEGGMGWIRSKHTFIYNSLKQQHKGRLLLQITVMFSLLTAI